MEGNTETAMFGGKSGVFGGQRGGDELEIQRSERTAGAAMSKRVCQFARIDGLRRAAGVMFAEAFVAGDVVG